MDFDQPLSFSYDDFTGNFGKNIEMYWTVNFSNHQLSVITKADDEQKVVDYLSYLLVKGAKFIDDEKLPFNAIHGSSYPEITKLLYP